MEAVPAPSKIGIFGGSFNPIHFGHLRLAEWVCQTLKLDRLILVPTFKPYYRDDCLASFSDRLQLLKLALSEFSFSTLVEVSDVELILPLGSYTIEVLKYFKKKYPNSEFIEIIGEDAFKTFHQWKNSDEILQNSTVVVLSRCQEKITRNEKNIKFLSNPIIEISATEIREAICNGKSLENFLPRKCIEYIEKEKLWRE